MRKRMLLTFSLTLTLALCVALILTGTAAKAAMINVPDLSSQEPDSSGGDFPVRIVNESGYLMSVALVYFDRDKRQLRCEGWWNVVAHSDRRFNLRHLKGRPIFYYVECQGRAYSKLKSKKGVDWRVSKIKFSYLKGESANLMNPYKVHFVRGGPTDAGWWQLTIK